MNVITLCDFLRPLITPQYQMVRPARKVEADQLDRDADLPLCVVHPWREQARESRYDNFVRQRSDQQFAVVTICKIEDLETYRPLIFSALLGKTLPGYIHDMRYVSGETLDIDASVIWWRDIFDTAVERSQT